MPNPDQAHRQDRVRLKVQTISVGKKFLAQGTRTAAGDVAGSRSPTRASGGISPCKKQMRIDKTAT